MREVAKPPSPKITDASGTAQSASAVGNRWTYTGREWEQSLSLYHYRARIYDSMVGRFYGRDPIGYDGNKWNFYVYCHNSPQFMVDPSGNVAWWIPCTVGITAMAVCEGPGVLACANATDNPVDFFKCMIIYGQLRGWIQLGIENQENWFTLAQEFGRCFAVFAGCEATRRCEAARMGRRRYRRGREALISNPA